MRDEQGAPLVAAFPYKIAAVRFSGFSATMSGVLNA
jgi:hypothetical protein